MKFGHPDPEQGCDIPTIKDSHYSFNQNTDVIATLPLSPLDNFCGEAKHNSSPKTYSIDSAAMIIDENILCQFIGIGKLEKN